MQLKSNASYLKKRIKSAGVRGETHQSVQELELQWRHSAAELCSVGAGLLAALQQLKQRCIHVEGLWGSGSKAFKVQDGRAQEGDLQGRQQGNLACSISHLGGAVAGRKDKSPVKNEPLIMTEAVVLYLAGALVLSGHHSASLPNGHLKVLQDRSQCRIGSTSPLQTLLNAGLQ